MRYTKSAFITFSPEGIPLHSEFANTKINVTQRFAYEQVMPLISGLKVEGGGLRGGEANPSTEPEAERTSTSSAPQPATLNPQPTAVAPHVLALLRDMHGLAMILRKRRFARGALDLNLPEVKLDLRLDNLGRH